MPKCALGKLLVHLLVCVFEDIIRAIELVILPVAVAMVRYEYQLYSSAQKVHVVYTRMSTTGCKSAPNMLFIIHYLCTCAVSKLTVKTDPAKTGPAGPLAMAMQMV